MNTASEVFEVQIASDGRWTIETVFHDERSAVARAAQLVKTDAGETIRILKDDGRWRPRVIFEKACLYGGKQKTTLNNLAEAPVCSTLADYYGFPARRAIARLLKNFLSLHQVSALELLHDAQLLRDLETRDDLLEHAIGRVASLQTRGEDKKVYFARIDELSKAFREIYLQARGRLQDRSDLELLRDSGLDALLDKQRPEGPDAELEIRVGAALAGHTAAAVDWPDKLERLIALFQDSEQADGKAMLDGIIAECLDSSESIGELLQYQPNLGTALCNLTAIARGRAEFADDQRLPAELNRLMQAEDLPLTRGVLRDRVAQSLGGTRPLDKEGRTGDIAVFADLFKALGDYGGIWGGEYMAQSLTRRAQIIYGDYDGDLSIGEAVEELLRRMPSNAMRLGYLLDLAGSELGRANEAEILLSLQQMIAPIEDIKSLLPEDASADLSRHVIWDLQQRVDESILPPDVSRSLDQRLARLAEAADSDSQDEKPMQEKSKIPGRKAKAAKARLDRQNVAEGEYVFQEGAPGDEAYIILSGEIEILRRQGDEEKTIAILGRGEILGEMALIEDLPRMAAARAQTATTLAIIPRDVFRSKLDRLAESDRVIHQLIETLVSRLRNVPIGD